MSKLLMGLLVLAVAILGVSLSTNTVQADDAPLCVEHAIALIAVIADVDGDLNLSPKVEAGLDRKAVSILNKLEKEKFVDADQKIMDFEANLNKLEATIVGAKNEKISFDDEAALRVALNALKDCRGLP